MKTHKYIFLLLLSIVIAVGCREDSILITEDETELPELEDVTYQFLVTNELGNPISDAQILINTEVYTSDENGIAITQPQKVSSLGLAFKVTALEYEPILKRVDGADGAKISETVVLFKAVNTVISTGGSGLVDGGGKLSLPSNLKASDGSVYSGDVTVKSKYLDPDNKDFLRSAPGNLLALNTADEYQLLASLGMYLIELYDDNGGALELPEGSSAIIEFPIADRHKNNVGGEIPLWYFDENKGVWIEDGIAKVEGDVMIAEVNHFTWWNCDLPYDFTKVCLSFLDNDGESMPGLEVEFSINGVSFGLATTDVNGNINAKVPIDFIFELSYYIGGIETGSQSVGSFEEGAKKEIINTGLDLIKISGNTIDCDGNELSNGYVYYSTIDGIFPVLLTSNGSFCYYGLGVEHHLTIIDVNTNKITEIEISEVQQQMDLELGIIEVCEDENLTKLSGYVFLDTDGDNIGDTPVADIEINIYGIGEPKSLKTDQDGYYETVVLPGIQNYITAWDANYVAIAAGDESPDGSVAEELFMIGNFDAKVVVPQDEHDRDNNFVVIARGYGTISGSALGDSDNDGIGDVPLEWMTFAFQKASSGFSDVDGVIVQADGSFSFVSKAGYKELLPDPYFFITDFIVDWDTSLDSDGDGDDSALGPNGRIPIILREEELDEDNEFVINISNRFNLLCRVLEDTDGDNIGDTPLSNLRINIKKRNTDDVIKTTITNVRGMIDYIDFGTSNKVELTLEIEDTEYEIINIIDDAPDTDPLIIGGDLTKMEIDLEKGEWDAGNTFIVRKI